MKIIKEPKIEKIKCFSCGCEYTYETGDKLQHDVNIYVACGMPYERENKGCVFACPVCGFENKVDIINYDE